jgi:uracil-DNA glycosylase
MTWDELAFWQLGDWQAVQERLDDLDEHNTLYNPDRSSLFAALDAVEFESVRVCILGQDPYPIRRYATGVAFSIPKDAPYFPPTLENIFREYRDDLHYPLPTSGCLLKWCEQGVLLWNVIPTCQTGKSMSHDWVEWTFLTQEIIEKLSSENNCVFVALGNTAQKYLKYIKEPEDNRIIMTSHPSPLASGKSAHPFFGSRMFSTINMKLREINYDPIDWRL